MGFDVLYLPPIHPIGHSGRKGRNNTLEAAPDDVGSPWAIGNENGGHTAIEPALGTLVDFDRFVETARDLGMEVALDYALQCSPDHPWLKQHPRIELVYLPTYCPKANPIERAFGDVHDKCTRNHQRKRLRDLVADV